MPTNQYAISPKALVVNSAQNGHPNQDTELTASAVGLWAPALGCPFFVAAIQCREDWPYASKITITKN